MENYKKEMKKSDFKTNIMSSNAFPYSVSQVSVRKRALYVSHECGDS